jgi:hypothetical protein
LHARKSTTCFGKEAGWTTELEYTEQKELFDQLGVERATTDTAKAAA